MKVILVNGSPNEKGCTYTALSEIEKTFAIFREFKNSGKCVAKAPGLHL